MNSVGKRYAGQIRYRPRARLIPESINPGTREFLWSHRGIALRDPIDERVEHRGRVSHEAVARDESSPINQ